MNVWQSPSKCPMIGTLKILELFLLNFFLHVVLLHQYNFSFLKALCRPFFFFRVDKLNKVLINFIFFKAFRNNFAKILLVFIASDPPFKITAFPDLKHRAATSDVTLGLLS